MSAEDLEIHQPADAPVKKRYLHLNGSVGDGLDSLLQKGKGFLRGGRSLPSLLDPSSHPYEADHNDINEEDDVDVSTEDDIKHQEQENTLIKISVDHH